MHRCGICDAACNCSGDTSGIIGDNAFESCSHCALCCEHGYPLETPCMYCDTADFQIDDDTPAAPIDPVA